MNLTKEEQCFLNGVHYKARQLKQEEKDRVLVELNKRRNRIRICINIGIAILCIISLYLSCLYRVIHDTQGMIYSIGLITLFFSIYLNDYNHFGCANEMTHNKLIRRRKKHGT